MEEAVARILAETPPANQREKIERKIEEIASKLTKYDDIANRAALIGVVVVPVLTIGALLELVIVWNWNTIVDWFWIAFFVIGAVAYAIKTFFD